MNLNDLLAYRADLATEHQADLAALDRLIARERAKSAVPQATNGSSHQTPVQNDTKTSVFVPHVGPAIQKALNKVGNGNFTKDHIVALLNDMGVSMEGWGPRAVGVNLWRRAKLGELVTVKDGTGGTAVVYRKA